MISSYLLYMDERQLKAQIAGKMVTAMEYTEPDSYGYSSDSVIFHLEGDEELRVYISVNGNEPSLAVDAVRASVPLLSVYPRLDRVEMDDVIEDLSMHYNACGNVSSVTISLSSGNMRLSVAEDDLYSIRID